MRPNVTRKLLRVPLVLSAVLGLFACLHAQTLSNGNDLPFTEGSLYEIKDKTRVQLLVFRVRVLDAAGDSVKSAVEGVRNGQHTERKLAYPYAVIGSKLNKYIRKYGHISSVDDSSQADYFIVFNLLRYRRILYTVYPSGELFVITYTAPDPPRVVWKTSKEMLAEDAANKLIEAMKLMRRER